MILFKCGSRKSIDITPREVREGLAPKSENSLLLMKEELNALQGNLVPKECLIILLNECAELYRFRDAMKCFVEMRVKEVQLEGIFDQKEKEKEDEVAQLNAIRQKIKEKQVRLEHSDRQQLKKLQKSCQQQKIVFKALIASLAAFSQSENTKSSERLQSMVNNYRQMKPFAKDIFESLKSKNFQIQTLQMTLQLHIQERRRQEMIIYRLTHSLEEHSKCTHIKVLISIASHLRSFLVEFGASPQRSSFVYNKFSSLATEFEAEQELQMILSSFKQALLCRETRIQQLEAFLQECRINHEERQRREIERDIASFKEAQQIKQQFQVLQKKLDQLESQKSKPSLEKAVQFQEIVFSIQNPNSIECNITQQENQKEEVFESIIVSINQPDAKDDSKQLQQKCRNTIKELTEFKQKLNQTQLYIEQLKQQHQKILAQLKQEHHNGLEERNKIILALRKETKQLRLQLHKSTERLQEGKTIIQGRIASQKEKVVRLEEGMCLLKEENRSLKQDLLQATTKIQDHLLKGSKDQTLIQELKEQQKINLKKITQLQIFISQIQAMQRQKQEELDRKESQLIDLQLENEELVWRNSSLEQEGQQLRQKYLKIVQEKEDLLFRMKHVPEIFFLPARSTLSFSNESTPSELDIDATIRFSCESQYDSSDQ